MLPSSSQVTVIIPNRNRTAPLLKAISSLRKQTFARWNAWVVDDHSDASEVADVYEQIQQDRRIRVIRLTDSHPPSACRARNTGLDQSLAPYVCFFDSDDELHPEALERRLRVIESEHADAVFSFFQRTFMDGRMGEVCGPYPGPLNPFERIVKGCYSFCANAALFRRDFLVQHSIRWNESLQILQDQDFLLNFFSVPSKIAISFERDYFWCNASASEIPRISHAKGVQLWLYELRFLRSAIELIRNRQVPLNRRTRAWLAARQTQLLLLILKTRRLHFPLRTVAKDTKFMAPSDYLAGLLLCLSVWRHGVKVWDDQHIGRSDHSDGMRRYYLRSASEWNALHDCAPLSNDRTQEVHKTGGVGSGSGRTAQSRLGLLFRRSRDCEIKREILSAVRDGCSIISFDIFDTAIKRDVTEPKKVFEIVQDQIPAKIGIELGFDFSQFRVAAELRSRAHARAQGRNDVSINEIYSTFADMTYGILPGDVVRKIQQLEVSTEARLLSAIPETFAAYEMAKDLGLCVIFISDMYLPESTLRDFLYACGYRQPDRIFVSSEYSVSKSSGGLFEIVKAHYPHQKILHFGDNYHSDVHMARAAGLRSKHTQPFHLVGKKLTVHLGKLRYARQIPGGMSSKIETAWSTGYGIMGPLMVGFALWFIDRIRQRGADRIFFLARDGALPMKILQTIESAFGERLPPYRYLYVSRRSVMVPSLDRFDLPTINRLMNFWGSDRVGNIFQRMGVDVESPRFVQLLAQFNLKCGSIVHAKDPADRTTLSEIAKILETEILSCAGDERVKIASFMMQEGVWGHGHAAVIDLGWRGTLQHLIQQLAGAYGQKFNSTGFYIGTYGPEIVEREGYLFEPGRDVTSANLMKRGVDLLENLSSFPEGTVIGYDKDPVSGRIVPRLQANSPIERAKDVVAAVHEGAVCFAKDVLPSINEGILFSITPRESSEGFWRLITRPTNREVACFGSIRHSSEIGADNNAQPLVAYSSIRRFFNIGSVNQFRVHQ